MSDKKKQPQIGFRTEVTPYISGHVRIDTYHYQPEGVEGWFPTLEAAHRDAAKRMTNLASELLRQADYLRQDPRAR